MPSFEQIWTTVKKSLGGEPLASPAKHLLSGNAAILRNDHPQTRYSGLLTSLRCHERHSFTHDSGFPEEGQAVLRRGDRELDAWWLPRVLGVS
jgi:hypothetical protein